jgi:dipeptidyl aminopeptidase/acylaminoacyl peptidase
MTPEDLLRLRVITGAEISPDGRSVAYAIRDAHLDRNEYTSAIYLVPTDPDGGSGSPRQFTSGEHRDSDPRWSPDGRRLAFVSDRSGKNQIYVIDADGGEPRRLTDLSRGARNPVWSPDGRRIAFLSTEGNGIDDDERSKPGGMIRHVTRLPYRFDVTGYIDDRFPHVWVVDAEGSEARQITWGDQDDLDPTWSPDGSQIAFVSNRENDIHVSFWSQVYRVSVDGDPPPSGSNEDGATRVSRGTELSSLPVWSPDGSQIAFLGRPDGARSGANIQVYLAPASGDGDVRSLTAGFDRSAATSTSSDTWNTRGAPTHFWSPAGDALYFSACDRGSVHLFRADLDGEVSRAIGGERTVAFASISSGDHPRFAFAAGDFTNPCDIYTCALDGAGERRLTSINAGVLADLPVQEPEHMPFESFDGGFEVDAWLIRPVGFEPGKQYPLVQIIHGGPHSIYGRVFFFDMQLWASQGWNVLFINPRASQGYGEEFATCNLGDWGGADWREQEMALDLAIERGGVDPERLAVTGLSYGGFMTNWIVGQTDRYRVGVSENSISNLVSFFFTSDIGWYWLERSMEREFWPNLDWWMERSPITYVPNMKTPLLLLQAETDWRCPIEQGEQMYAALKSRGVPCEMVTFPGESHGFQYSGKPESRLQRRQHALRWFKEYL